MLKKYLRQIKSKEFINKLILNFEKHSYKVFWEFSDTKNQNVGEYIKDDPCGIGAAIGKLFERIFKLTCDDFKIPCKRINAKDADFLIDETRFEIKTARDVNGLYFMGSGVKNQGHKKCGNYILIGYKFDNNKIVSHKSLNRKLFINLFYSVSVNIIKTRHWVNTSGKTFILRFPNNIFNRINKNIILGSVTKGKGELKILKFLPESLFGD